MRRWRPLAVAVAALLLIFCLPRAADAAAGAVAGEPSGPAAPPAAFPPSAGTLASVPAIVDCGTLTRVSESWFLRIEIGILREEGPSAPGRLTIYRRQARPSQTAPRQTGGCALVHQLRLDAGTRLWAVDAGREVVYLETADGRFAAHLTQGVVALDLATARQRPVAQHLIMTFPCADRRRFAAIERVRQAPAGPGGTAAGQTRIVENDDDSYDNARFELKLFDLRRTPAATHALLASPFYSRFSPDLAEPQDQPGGRPGVDNHDVPRRWKRLFSWNAACDAFDYVTASPAGGRGRRARFRLRE